MFTELRESMINKNTSSHQKTTTEMKHLPDNSKFELVNKKSENFSDITYICVCIYTYICEITLF